MNDGVIGRSPNRRRAHEQRRDRDRRVVERRDPGREVNRESKAGYREERAFARGDREGCATTCECDRSENDRRNGKAGRGDRQWRGAR